MNHRTLRLAASLALAVTLVASIYTPTLAALPNVEHHADAPVPAVASNSAVAHFHVWAINNDTSTLSQFFLFATTTGNVRSATAYFTPPLGSATLMPAVTCTQSGSLFCTFGQMKPGVRFDVFVDFNTAASGTVGDVTFDWNSTGTPPGKNRSHGDNFEDTVPLTLIGSSDFFGTYVADSSLAIVTDSNSLGRGNKQSTLVVSPATGIPVTVSDGGVIACTPHDIAACPTTFFGETSVISVDNGTNYSPNLFEVVLQLYKPGVNPSQVNGVYHEWTDSLNAVHDELITASCPATGTPTSECFTASKLGAQNLEVDVWLFHNGTIHTW